MGATEAVLKDECEISCNSTDLFFFNLNTTLMLLSIHDWRTSILYNISLSFEIMTIKSCVNLDLELGQPGLIKSLE